MGYSKILIAILLFVIFLPLNVTLIMHKPRNSPRNRNDIRDNKYGFSVNKDA